jgi:hypothetical protein
MEYKIVFMGRIVMSRNWYLLVLFGIVLLVIGIAYSLIQEDCYNKTPQEYYESRICQYVCNH